jgi:hypothetical protein
VTEETIPAETVATAAAHVPSGALRHYDTMRRPRQPGLVAASPLRSGHFAVISSDWTDIAPAGSMAPALGKKRGAPNERVGSFYIASQSKNHL